MDEQLRRLRALLLLPEPQGFAQALEYHEAINGVDQLETARFDELVASLASTKLAPWSVLVLEARQKREGQP